MEKKLEERVLDVLCGRIISSRVKGKLSSPLYKMAVRQAVMYDAGTCAVKKARGEVGCGGNEDVKSEVTKLGRIINERNRGTTKVGEISKKLQESRLKWYGYT